MTRRTDLRTMRVWLSAAVTVAGVRPTARHTGLPLSTLAKRCKRDDWTVEELARLAPVFGGRLILETPDDRPPGETRANPFYR